ncbi:MAG: tRNA pseudouridine(55) synthase TruB [Alphaproteobacteria bacterium]|uniref:tRNA pseudouridine synthase B n=1 Tax=Candidatus Nitrobium versatile TaxID=2884831 RepID=A0A953J7L1_9BACT|nr:tRNA pseudouridine(55) synthase TruB [Candidatus Nitrobium versatile]
MNIVVNLNKSLNTTSQDAVTAVKRIFKVRKAGHAGTLDPLATGVLLICLNEGTKITGFLADLAKEYVMTGKLGESTDTYDAEGTVTGRAEEVAVTRASLEEALGKYTGDIEQVPPMYSAIKREGKALYELARQGIEVERKPRRVTISSIELLDFELPYFTVRVACSKGTYLRSLCHDIGSDLGVGAYVTGLVRTRIGGFTLENAATLDELPHKTAALHSLDAALAHLPEVRVEGEDLRKMKNGNPLRMSNGTPRSAGPVRLKDDSGKLFGIGRQQKDILKIERLLHL